MHDILLAVGVVVFIIYAAFHIASTISIRRASESMREFFKNTEGDVTAVLSEVRGTVENIRRISKDVREVTADITQVSRAVAGMEKNIRDRMEYLDQMIASAAEANIAGLKAGITAGIATLMQKAANRKEDLS